jgi:hypothetical protein
LRGRAPSSCSWRERRIPPVLLFSREPLASRLARPIHPDDIPSGSAAPVVPSGHGVCTLSRVSRSATSIRCLARPKMPGHHPFRQCRASMYRTELRWCRRVQSNRGGEVLCLQ